MSQRVYKYLIPIQDDPVVHEMPAGAKVLRVDQQHPITGSPGTPLALWALVDTSAPTERRAFFVRGTGQSLPVHGPYVGTVVTGDGLLVWHVFEGVDPSNRWPRELA